MPCRVDPPYGPPSTGSARTTPNTTSGSKERRVSSKVPKLVASQSEVDALESHVHSLSVVVDRLRDVIYLMVQEIDTDDLPVNLNDEIAEILSAQVDHRAADLNRLIKTFGSDPTPENVNLLRLVLAASPASPLEPQLGFDPDAY